MGTRANHKIGLFSRQIGKQNAVSFLKDLSVAHVEGQAKASFFSIRIIYVYIFRNLQIPKKFLPKTKNLALYSKENQCTKAQSYITDASK